MADADDASFEAYFVARAADLRRSAYLLTGNWHEADDVVQSAFVRLYSAWHRVRPDTVDAYTRRVLVNAFLSTKRGQRNREQPVAEVPEASVSHSIDDRLAVRAALSQLTAKQRAVVVLRYWEQLDVKETAAALGVSAGTVKSQLSKAVRAMRPHLSTDLGST